MPTTKNPPGRQDNEVAPDEGTSRRRFVVRTIGGLTGAALLGACGEDVEGSSSEQGGTGASTSASASSGEGGTPGTGGAPAGSGGQGGGTGGTGPTRCTVYPQQTEGPFYLDDDLVRADITEGRPGAPMTLRIQVVGAGTCAPMEGVAVDVWQNDAAGVYSGFPNQLGGLDTTGQTFLRGTQLTDADGFVTFTTIYPGWYPGRTTHIHFKVHPTSTTEATSQLYFPEDVTATVYTLPPYDAHGPKNTTNAQDGPFQDGEPSLLMVTETADGYTAELTVAVAVAG